MKKKDSKKYYKVLAVAAIFAATACSHSDEPSSSQNERRIEFETTISNYGDNTRQADITTTENIPEFKIWAYDYGIYSYVMNGVTVTRTGLNSWTYSPAVDWTGNMMCFTAVSPASIEINTNPWWLDMIQYKNYGQEDLLVCRVTNVRQTNGRLKLHFYHALSMVDVRIHTTLPPNTVKVKSVNIVNVSDIGQFRYASAGYNSTTTLKEISEGWDIYGQSNKIPVFFSDASTYLTDLPLDADNQGYDFFIPSLLAEFNFDTYFNSSYLEVDYLIENPDGTVVWPDSATDYRLISRENPGYGTLRLSLSDQLPENRWLAGARYRYNLNLSGPAVVPTAAKNAETRSGKNVEMTVDITTF